jgi:hypothetical protein
MAGNGTGNPNRRGPWFALVTVIAVFVIGWILARQLYKSQQLENCFMEGRTNCAPIEIPSK